MKLLHILGKYLKYTIISTWTVFIVVHQVRIRKTRISPLLLDSLQIYFDGQWRLFGSTFRGGHSLWYQVHRISNSYYVRTVANDGQMSKTLPLNRCCLTFEPLPSLLGNSGTISGGCYFNCYCIPVLIICAVEQKEEGDGFKSSFIPLFL